MTGASAWIDRWASRLCAFAGVLLLPAALYASFYRIAHSHVFLVDEVEVVGDVQQSEASILEAAGLDRPRNVLSCRRAAMAASIEALPWVIAAEVAVDLRGAVRITVLETELHALAVLDVPTLVDADGTVIRAWQPDDGVVEPILVGLANGDRLDSGRFREANEVLAALAALEPLAPASELHFDPVHGYDVVLRDETRIELGRGRLDARLDRLEDVIVALEDEALEAQTIRFGNNLARVAVTPRGRSAPTDGAADGQE